MRPYTSKLRDNAGLLLRRVVVVCLLSSLLFPIYPTRVLAGRCSDSNVCDTCPVSEPRGGCMGPWGIKIKEENPGGINNNRRKLEDAINDYLKLNTPKSRFLEIDDPGFWFVNAGLKHGVNPLILLGIANAESNMATSGQSMECGNPWSQTRLGNNKGCKSSKGAIWYEYNSAHTFDPAMIEDQTDRIKRLYVNNPQIRNFDDFFESYMTLNFFKKVFSSVDPDALKSKIKEPMNAIKKVARASLTCSGSSVKPGSKEEWIELFMQAEEITGVPWEFIAAITWNETSMGGNLGGCAYHPPPPDGGWILTSGDGLRSSEDLSAFDRIVGSVDMPLNAPVSCNPSGSNGGAMGYTQVMPQEWEAKTEWMEQTQGHYPSPWDAQDSVTIAGLILKDKAGISLDEPFPEDTATMLEAAGWYHGSGPTGSYAANAVATYLQIKLTGELP